MAGMQRRRLPRLVWVFVPAVAFVGLLAAAVIRQDGAPQAGDRAPNFEAELLDGDGSLALADLRGKPVFVNFWASWCGPCLDEAPILKRAWDEYGDEVQFVGIDIRDARSDALEFVDAHHLGYPHLWDEGLKIYESYGLSGQPESFFIDQDGIVVEHVNGPLFEDTLSQLLDVLVRRNG
jgi:cytochrome c biogenesis protein CcmG/thiol:disulfide interchange protein DsbE